MTKLASTPAINPDTAALVGYIVMAVLLVLAAVVIFALVKSFSAKKNAVAAEEPASEVITEIEEIPQPTAPGTAGQLKLHDVEPRTAAMLMAIVAYKTGKPLNELRFISIKEVK